MGAEEAQTERLIKEKAKILFFQKGFLNATTQEIADEAGVNRALIHYYFRSREQLLDTLLDETLQEKKDRVRNILTSELPFREKIAYYIDTVVDYGLTYPYLDNFIISETARHPDKVKMFCAKDRFKSSDLIRDALNKEVKKGKIAAIAPEHFMVNLISLCNYPLLAKSVIQTIHGMTDAAYRKFLVERKQIIFRTIFNEEMPELNRKEESTKHAFKN
ncbi:TetR/AcrR family transcriptional regulator [Chryseolinea sp. H1M3-3]|uniref:TetR/AcrR family transcriptional regulator n=1 Tax=Chryseolinea sp. H1M3-3 TaxID=3034144 RepID=UPI0023ED0A9D|nr:TetR/AcrR family transcriptional regulator [Chryseolinea sp. H1M3-3]